MTAGSTALADYQLFKELHRDAYARMTKREARLLREADVVCALDLRRAVKGRANGCGNMLVSNFFSLMHGTLNEANMGYKDIGGVYNPGGYPLRTAGDVSAGSAYLAFGTETGDTGFGGYALSARNTALEGTIVAPSLLVSPSEGRARIARVTAGTVYEVGIYQSVNDTSGRVQTAMWARLVPPSPIPTGVTVFYDVIFKPPFVHNTTRLFYGVLSNANVEGCEDVTGAVFAVRASADVNAGPVNKLFLGSGTAGPDHTVAVPVNPLLMTTTRFFNYEWGSYYDCTLVGGIKLDADMSISEVVLTFPAYDSAGAARDMPVARWPVSPPVEKRAGEYASAFVVIYATA